MKRFLLFQLLFSIVNVSKSFVYVITSIGFVMVTNTTKICIRLVKTWLTQLVLLIYGPKEELISGDTSEAKPDKLQRFLRFI